MSIERQSAGVCFVNLDTGSIHTSEEFGRETWYEPDLEVIAPDTESYCADQLLSASFSVSTQSMQLLGGV